MARHTREDAAVTRARILASAQQLIRHRGLHCVTVDDVARAIGMTRGAVYGHFRSRAELLGALLSCAEADFAARLAPLAQAGAAPEALAQALQAFLHGDELARHVSLIAALLQHKCGEACELCPLRERVLRGVESLRVTFAMLLPSPDLAGLLLAHLWGLLGAHAMHLAPAGLSGSAAALARLYQHHAALPAARASCRSHATSDPAPMRDTP
ncbi:TetR/AcrR family transcriptional regulator [Cupriavidus alkaliphilus]|uniref:TetR/AcrR family transcriptional regulator n=1 Tax=Cupriavidus alkaliphilus TaxID=942866 RepID=UPI000DC325D8|nr:TetR family transcriptional regulator [Cupriavidus alkaliphilus]MBB3015725.1 TetR/AcrR family acrAB operon transcriptional repressor [Cupriavidus alkaliphilus]RAS09384.1 TetR family transcriptional regulator [Cupriavidus alkaliphilus]